MRIPNLIATEIFANMSILQSMNTKNLFTSTIALTLFGSMIVNSQKIAIARPNPPTPVQCYFFKGETLQLENTCTYQGSSWAGGGSHSLTWKDGIVTSISYGLGARGAKTCADGEFLVDDKVCAVRYSRSSKTLKRISNNSDSDRVNCVQMKGKSICWKP
jgi:hypothetical protein